MTVLVLSASAALIAVGMNAWTGVTAADAFALFLGLEGTVLLSSSISQDEPGAALDRPTNFFRAIMWHFGEGRHLNYPVNYNPVYFYGGLLLLAASFVLSAIPG